MGETHQPRNEKDRPDEGGAREPTAGQTSLALVFTAIQLPIIAAMISRWLTCASVELA
ncbi:MAG: hypothetical protein AB2747_16965 [Candidatus Thiodiazotropha taylori]